MNMAPARAKVSADVRVYDGAWCTPMSPPSDVVYVGDDLRDIQAARAAGMVSVAALWGYREAHDDPATWGADHALASARDLLSAPGLLPT